MSDLFTFQVSEYSGNEQEVLAMLNRNRDEQIGMEYMRWRYLGEDTSSAPIVIWAEAANGKRVGMAALIPRTYWVDGERTVFPYRGDISIDEHYRGRGVGKDLYGAILDYVEREGFVCCLGLPNVASQGAALSAGFEQEDTFVSHVLVLNPYERVLKRTKSPKAARVLSAAYTFASRSLLGIRRRKHLTLTDCASFDGTFDELWNAFPKANLIMRDRSAATLQWRYHDHPTTDFKILRLLSDSRFVGYLVYAIVDDDSCCEVYDVVAMRASDVGPAISQLALRMMNIAGVKQVRIRINKGHPYARVFRGVGFVPRNEDTGVVTCSSSEMKTKRRALSWFADLGDKDI